MLCRGRARRFCSSWVARTTFSRRRPAPSIFDDTDVAAALTKEMRSFMDRVAAKPPDAWFHRKSEKLVLAVLMVHVEGEPRFVPGINAEVSLPAGGSFCAERSAIVAARAMFPGISRADFAGIAVVEVPLVHDRDPLRSSNPLRPCGACSEWLTKLQEANPDFRVVTYTNLDLLEIDEFLPDGSRWKLEACAETVAVHAATGAAMGAHTCDATPTPLATAAEGEGEEVVEVEGEQEGGQGGREMQYAHGDGDAHAQGGLEMTGRRKSTLARLATHFPPPKGFRRHNVVRRIPWFPVWWFEDLVRLGHLEIADEGGDPKGKGTKYRVNSALLGGGEDEQGPRS